MGQLLHQGSLLNRSLLPITQLTLNCRPCLPCPRLLLLLLLLLLLQRCHRFRCGGGVRRCCCRGSGSCCLLLLQLLLVARVVSALQPEVFVLLVLVALKVLIGDGCRRGGG
jgi:hypothetical protein